MASPEAPRRDSSAYRSLLVVALVLVLLITLYSAVEISGLQSQISTLQSQEVSNQAGLQSLQNSLSYLESRLSSTTTQSQPQLSFAIVSACISLSPLCPPTINGSPRTSGAVYWIQIENDGSGPISNQTSVFLSFKDASKPSYFGFNTTLGQAIVPNFFLDITGTTWPQYTNATLKLSPGDTVVVGVTIGGVSAKTTVTVYSCPTSTTTFINDTQTQTATQAICS